MFSSKDKTSSEVKLNHLPIYKENKPTVFTVFKVELPNPVILTVNECCHYYFAACRFGLAFLHIPSGLGPIRGKRHTERESQRLTGTQLFGGQRRSL